MTRTEGKLAIQIASLGAVIILIVIVIKFTGLLRALDNWIYDTRAQHFQYFNKPPTDRLVHLDIDDNAIATIGGWPWKRTEWANIIDELSRAGAKTIGFDVFFSEFQDVEHRKQNNGTYEEIDHDQAFASAIKRAGNVVLGVPLKVKDDAARVPDADVHGYQAMLEAFRVNLGASPDEVKRHLISRKSSDVQADDYLNRFMVSARSRAMFQLILMEMSSGNGELTEAQVENLRVVCRTKFLDPLPPRAQSLLKRSFEAEFDRAYAVQAMAKFGVEPPPIGPSFLAPQDELSTIPDLSKAAASSGFVDDYLRFEDGTVRSLPLWVKYRGKLFPQFGLALACQYLNVPPADVVITEHEVVIPAKGFLTEPIRIPVYTRHSRTLRQIGAVMDIPWFGPPEWEQMYDSKASSGKHHYSLVAAWSVWDSRQKVVRSAPATDLAIQALLGPDGRHPDGRVRKGFKLDEQTVATYASSVPKPDDMDAREQMARKALSILAESRYVEEFEKQTELTENDRFELAELRGARDVLTEFLSLCDQVRTLEATLRSQVQDKAVLIGWIAEGKVDLVPTPLHSAAPGAVVHGAVFNSILQNHFTRRAPAWVSYAFLVLIGIAATLLASFLPPWQSLMATLLLVISLGLVDALLVFDYANIILAAAGPAVVAPAIWSVLTVVRFIVERAERDRITRRFSSYVDPVLVEYVLTNPQSARLEGQERELTVVFTDLGGFTTLTEHLGKGTVPILNDYMSLMVPIIRKHGGYVNKFLGDGIMFFFGAPKPSPTHATQAVDAVMEMQAAMGPFNQQLEARGLPTLTMRAGINTGEMIVGDAGPVDGSDYTVLGDAVNLAARLESANKATGTLVMIGQRTAETINGRYLLMPLARLQVKGKTEGVMTYAPLALADSATEEQRRQSKLYDQMVELFCSGRFTDCTEVIERIEGQAGATRITQLYREKCMEEKPEAFDGTIVLAEK